MIERCNVLTCEFNTDGKCLCCDDLHNPDKSNDCISYICNECNDFNCSSWIDGKCEIDDTNICNDLCSYQNNCDYCKCQENCYFDIE